MAKHFKQAPTADDGRRDPEPSPDTTVRAAPLGAAAPLATDPAAPSTPPGQPAPRRRRVAWVAVPVGIVAVAAAAYLAGVAYFSGAFLPGTTLDGEDVSLRSHEEVAQEKSYSLDGYSLHVTGNGLDLTVTAGDVDLVLDGAGYVSDATAGLSPWAWPVELAETRDLTAEPVVSFDADRLSALVTPAVEAATQDTSTLENHGIAYDAASASFVLDDAVSARHLNVDAVIDAVSAAITAQQDELVIGDECLEDTSELTAAINAANALMASAGTTLSLSGTKVLDITPDLLASWVRVGDDLSVTLDEDAVGQWVTENVGALDTAGKERTYTRADGKQISVSGGTWGIITNESETKTALLDALRAGSPQAIEIPLKQSTGVAADAGGRDWGPRYIDIDLTEQHVRMYDDSGALIWESDCVSGDSSKGYDTPTGVNPINSNKGTNQTLYGLDYDGDGEPDYESHVQYWIPFVGNLVALHDADWRSSFGGSIYTWNGSHGCVNLPVDKAAELYELTRVGDCVVVHY